MMPHTHPKLVSMAKTLLASVGTNHHGNRLASATFCRPPAMRTAAGVLTRVTHSCLSIYCVLGAAGI